VNVDEVASPFASVVSVSVLVVLVANVPDTPDAGAVKVTNAPLTGFPNSSVTLATSGSANAVPTSALCGVPLEAVIANGGPEVLDRLKVAAAAGRVAATTP
jgi:hypothetical protein